MPDREKPISKGSNPPPDLYRRLSELFAKREADERERIKRFGEIRPMMTAEAWGKRLVGAGGVYSLGDWKSFPQFLDDFLQFRVGSDWTQEQDNLDLAKAHPITYWRRRGLSHHFKALEGKPAGHLVQPGGFLAAYLGFAYDPYVVDDNNNLDESLSRAERFFGPPAPVPEPSPELSSIIDKARMETGGRDPYNLLVFTNIPHHYAADDEADPPKRWIAYVAQAPHIAFTDEGLLRDLALASELYGDVPSAFPAHT